MANKDQNQQMMNRNRGNMQRQQQGSNRMQQGQPYGFSRQGVIYDAWGQPTGVYYEEWTVSGPYTGTGPEGYHRPDDRIMEDVCDRLTQHGRLDARNIQVEVNNGEVTLKGMVDSRQARRMAEDTADSVPGVQDVHNELKVQRPPQQQDHMQ